MSPDLRTPPVTGPTTETPEDLLSPARILELWVPGVAKPGGSKRAFIRRKAGQVVGVGVADQSEGSDWRQRVAFFAREAFDGEPLDILLEVSFRFVQVRPRGHFGTGRNAGVLKASAPPAPGTRPDGLKLARLAEDALTGIVWVDDSRIVRHVIEKAYGSGPGVRITVAAA